MFLGLVCYVLLCQGWHAKPGHLYSFMHIHFSGVHQSLAHRD